MSKYKDIIDDLLNTNLSLKDLSTKHNVSRQTISNINLGKTHKNENLNYPLRNGKKEIYTKNELGFIQSYSNIYTKKQLLLILQKGEIFDLIEVLDSDTIYPYVYEKNLEEKRKIIDILKEYREELLNGDDIKELEPYIKFLGRFEIPITKFIPPLMNKIYEEIWDYTEIEYYIKYRGTSNEYINLILDIYYDSSELNIDDDNTYWTDFEYGIYTLLDIMTPQQYTILKGMVDYTLFDDYIRRFDNEDINY